MFWVEENENATQMFEAKFAGQYQKGNMFLIDKTWRNIVFHYIEIRRSKR